MEMKTLTRRDFLARAAAVTVAVPGAGWLLAACGGSSAGAPVSGAPAASASSPPAGSPASGAAKPAASPAAASAAAGTTELSFFYPIAVGGPITKIIDAYVADFMKANPNIKVTPTFAGSYQDTTTKIQTTIDGGGQPPDTAVLLSTDLYAVKDADYVIPLDDFIHSSGGDKLVGDVFDAFMANSKDGGKVYGFPFQRSTVVMYYNKDLFKEAGLDPETPPKTWADMIAAAKKFAKPDGSRWGVEIPSDGFPYWVFQGMTLGLGKNIIGDAANKVTFNDPVVIQALQDWVDLGAKEKVSPASITIWATTPTDFTSGKSAMIWHTTGSLTNILKEAKFQVGVAFLPGHKQPGSPTGGGNFYLFKKTPAAKQQAAWKLIQFMSSPEIQARWTIDTGYVAARKSAWDTPALKDYASKTPQVLVARDQLQHAGKELSTHDGPHVTEIFGNSLQAALTGKKSPGDAMKDAQDQADKILSQFKS